MEQPIINFTPELFEKVICAVLCSFNSQTTNDEKQNALKFLENFKENDPLICSTISFEILKSKN